MGKGGKRHRGRAAGSKRVSATRNTIDAWTPQWVWMGVREKHRRGAGMSLRGKSAFTRTAFRSRGITIGETCQAPKKDGSDFGGQGGKSSDPGWYWPVEAGCIQDRAPSNGCDEVLAQSAGRCQRRQMRMRARQKRTGSVPVAVYENREGSRYQISWHF